MPINVFVLGGGGGILVFFFFGGGGSADFIFVGAGIFSDRWPSLSDEGIMVAVQSTHCSADIRHPSPHRTKPHWTINHQESEVNL